MSVKLTALRLLAMNTTYIQLEPIWYKTRNKFVIILKNENVIIIILLLCIIIWQARKRRSVFFNFVLANFTIRFLSFACLPGERSEFSRTFGTFFESRRRRARVR